MRRDLRRRLLALVALTLLALALVPAGTAKVEAQRELGLQFLADRVPTSGNLAANIAEAAHANRLDLMSWPTADDPVHDHIVAPGNAAANISLLRPLRALAFAGDLRADADEGALANRALSHLHPDGYGDPATINDDAYAILAFRAMGLAPTDERLAGLRAKLLASQHADGGWGWAVAGEPGTDMTGIVVEALRFTGGVPDDVALEALAFLGTIHVGTGGFGESPGSKPNCESTVWGLRATARLGGELAAADWGYLLGLQKPDGGFAHVADGASDLLCTTEAIALLGEVDPASIPRPADTDDGFLGIPGPSLPVLLIAVLATTFVAMSMRLREA